MKFERGTIAVTFEVGDSETCDSLNYSINSKGWATCQVVADGRTFALEFYSLLRFNQEVSSTLREKLYWIDDQGTIDRTIIMDELTIEAILSTIEKVTNGKEL